MILAAAKWIAVLALATLTAGFGSCNGGGGNPPEYVLQGSVSGLLPGESVVLQDFGSDTTTVSANGHFQFSRPVPGGAPYSITVLTQPNGQNCTTLNGSGTGTIGAGSLVSVACIVLGYTVRGTIQYATGPAVLELVNGQDGLVPIGPSVTVTEPQYNVPVAFTLISTAPIGTPYDVEFVSGPAHEGCFYVNYGQAGPGTAADVNVTIQCSGFVVPAVSGLLPNTSVILKVSDPGPTAAAESVNRPGQEDMLDRAAGSGTIQDARTAYRPWS